MKKTATFFVLLAVSLLLLVGCSEQETKAAAGAGQQAASGAEAAQQAGGEKTGEVGKLSFDKLYDFAKVKSYEYKMTSVANGQESVVNLKYSVSSDTMNSKPAWLQKSEMTAQGTNIVTNMWVDKTSYACLKINTVMEVAGQKVEQESPCPTEGPNAASRTAAKAPEVDYLGKESVTVPAGTFSADKYSAEGVTYWVSSSVGVPLKVEYTQAKMELVSYS